MRTPRLHVKALYLTVTLGIVFAGLPVAAESGPSQLFVVISPSSEAGPSGVVAFDVDSEGRLTQGATYATGGMGRARTSPQTAVVDPKKGLLFAPNNESDDISVFTIREDGSLSPVAGSPFLTGDGPSDMVLHPSGDWLYVKNFSIGVITVYQVAADGVLTLQQTVYAGFPGEMEVHPDGDYLYSADIVSGVRGFAIAADGTLSELTDSPFTYTSRRPIDVEIDSTGSRLWVLDLDEGLAVFDITATGELILTVDPPVLLSGFSRAFVLTGDDAHIYTSRGSPNVLQGFNVRGTGLPRELNRSPFSGDYTIIEMLEPEGSRTLYTVGRDTRRIGALGVAVNGRLSAPEFFDVTDEAGRAPAGAAFFADSRPSVETPE